MGARTGGDCFRANAHTMLALIDERVEPSLLELVHGLVTSSETGQRHIHCWVEIQREMVVDRSNGHDVQIPANLYYLIGEIDELELVRYSMNEMRQQLVQTRVYGPWDDWLHTLETAPHLPERMSPDEIPNGGLPYDD